MNLAFTPIAIPLFLGSALLLIIAWLAWQRREQRGARYLLWTALALFFYVVGYAFEVSSGDRTTAFFWLRFEYLGIPFAPVLFFMLVVAFTDGDRYLTPFNQIVLLTIPAATFLLAWTNAEHEWIWRDLTVERTEGYTASVFERGGWWWVHNIYIYTLIALMGVLLVRAFWRAEGTHRRQLGLMFIAIASSLVSEVIFIAGLGPTGLDLGAFGFIGAAVLMAVALFQYQFLDLMPVAREQVLASMREAVIVLDVQGRVVDVNPSARRMLGLEAVAVLGQPAEQALAAWPALVAASRDAVPTAPQALSAAFQQQETVFDLHVSPLLSQDNRVQGRALVLHDITARVQAEAALQTMNDRLTILRRVDADLTRRLDVRYVTTMGLDAAMRISLADAGYIGLAEDAGVRIIRMMGNCPDHVLNQLLPLEGSISARAIRTCAAQYVPDVSQDPDYKAMIASTQAQITVPLVSSTALLGVITLETAAAERFTQDVYETIQQLAARLAVAIENAQLYEKQDRLVQELDAFAHTVAHDLKNPLMLVTGYTYLLSEKRDALTEDQVADHINEIDRTAHKMANIIHELLLLAGVRKMDTVETTRLDMASIVDDAQARLKTVIADADAAIITPEWWPGAIGYRAWIEEVWANYISNAIKYGGTPPRVELGATRDGDMVRFWVRDNGPGLTPEQQAQLFTEFTRFHTVRAQGHGLGLSIVQRIMSKLGGEVGCESTVGAGSTFYFTLPAAGGPIM